MRVKGGAREGGRRERGTGESEAKVVELERQHFGEGERRLMISSSEVGGCCRVQVAWLFPLAALSALSSFASSSSSLSSSSCRHSAFPLSRRYHLLSPRSLYHSLQPPSCSRPFYQPPKIQNPSTIAEATHARRSLKACKVVLPSSPG